MKINIEVIPHSQQRYLTAGDYFTCPNGDIQIRVSDLGSLRENLLLIIHELVEKLLNIEDNITDEAVDTYDFQFELDRKQGKYPPEAEPGAFTAAPYYENHQVASYIETVLADTLCVDWDEYAKMVDALVEDEGASKT